MKSAAALGTAQRARPGIGHSRDGVTARLTSARTTEQQPAGRSIRRLPHLLPLLGLFVVVLLAGAGAFVAAGVMTGGSLPGDSTQASGPFGVAQEIRTSFGSFVVSQVEQVDGLSAQAVSGMSHSNGFVSDDKVQIMAAVTLTNRLNRPADYAPSQFRLRADKSEESLPATWASIDRGSLPPQTSVTANLKFVAPRDGSRLWIEYRELGRAEASLIEAGRTDQAPEGAGEGYHHGIKAGGDRSDGGDPTASGSEADETDGHADHRHK